MHSYCRIPTFGQKIEQIHVTSTECIGLVVDSNAGEEPCRRHVVVALHSIPSSGEALNLCFHGEVGRAICNLMRKENTIIIQMLSFEEPLDT